MRPEEFCNLHKIVDYKINDDNTIDVKGDVWLSRIKTDCLPVTFNKVYGSFYISKSELITLKGSPKWVGNSFSCMENYLTSLEHSPRYIGRNFNCRHNPITSLYGGPTNIVGVVYCDLTHSDGIDLDVRDNKIFNYNDVIKMINRKNILKKIIK